MDKIIQSLPNNTAVIICSLKPIDKNSTNYALVPQETAYGKIDEQGFFTIEGTTKQYMDVRRFEETYIDEESRYYSFPIEIDELKKKYPEASTQCEMLIAYYTEVKNNIHLLYRTESSDEVIVDTVIKRDKEDLRKLNEKIEKEYHSKVNAVHVNDDKDKNDLNLENIKRQELSKFLKERIFMNDSLMDDIATVIVANFRAKNPRLMKNILCVGPTGSGKTETFRLIAEYANLPITVVDCNQLTAEGFVGKGMDDIFKMIYATANGDKKKAERSILMLDEIDKIASKGDPIKDLDVQQGLLKVLEGYNFSFEHKRGSGQQQLDTTFMTKVGSGAFMDLFDKRKQKHALGFLNEDEKIEEKVLTDKDIIEYGFLPEFVGRFPLIYTYKPLDVDGLKRVLIESKISPLEQIRERLKEEFGCAIEYDDEFLEEIIDEALKTEAGGRSLAKIISQAFIKLEGALIDEVDMQHDLPKVLKLKKEMIKDPNNFNL